MADIVDAATRSRMMSRIRGKDTAPEMAVRKYLHSKGFRYRLHVKTLPGKPDIVLPRYRTVVFVHGCFWHQHRNCRNASMPQSNAKFWIEKLQGNVLRDKRHAAALRKAGWRVLVVWECQAVSATKLDALATKISLIC